MSDYPTSKRLCSLYRKKSKAGGSYFQGKHFTSRPSFSQ